MCILFKLKLIARNIGFDNRIIFNRVSVQLLHAQSFLNSEKIDLHRVPKRGDSSKTALFGGYLAISTKNHN